MLLLSWDKGTAGQGFFFVPGQRDDGTSHPGLSREVPFLEKFSRAISMKTQVLTKGHTTVITVSV